MQNVLHYDMKTLCKALCIKNSDIKWNYYLRANVLTANKHGRTSKIMLCWDATGDEKKNEKDSSFFLYFSRDEKWEMEKKQNEWK